MKQLILVLSIAALCLVGACSGSKATAAPKAAVISLDSGQSMQHQVVEVSPGESVEVTTPTPEALTSKPLFDTVYVEKAELINPQTPDKPEVRLMGSLPSACHKLYIKIDDIDKNNDVLIKALSIVQLPNRCNSTRLSFDHTVVIGGLKPGTYTIWVSQGKIGQVTIP